MPATGSDVGRAGDDDRHRRQAVEGGARTAENRLRSDPAYLRELATWTNLSSVGRDDGLPRHVLGPRGKDAGQGRGAAAARPGDWARTAGRRRRLRPDPTLLVLFTPDETPMDWIRAGDAWSGSG